MKKQLLFLVVMLLPMVTWADPVEIDGIYYNLVSKAKQAEVTSNPNHYSGAIVIPESVPYNGENYSVTSIGDQAFLYCLGLTSVIIPNSVTSIGSSAFDQCTSLTSVSIPNSVTSIGSFAFSRCTGLTSVNIPNSVTKIEGFTFEGCTGLTSITIPNSVTTLGEVAFGGCRSLISVRIPNSVTNIGYRVFEGCSSLTSVTIPNSVTNIGYRAFNGCTSLTSITIPNSVTVIYERAFYNCSNLASVTIGSGLLRIGPLAFANCSELTDVYCYTKNVPNTDQDTFEGSYIEYAMLHVPANSVNAYKTAEPWKIFMSIVKIDMPKHTLTYMVDGEVYKAYEIEEGETITPEETPTKEGYTFSGWSEIPETMPAHDVTVTGLFTINKYKLSYTVDGEEYKSYETEYGATITPEATPTKEGYTFLGWSELPGTMPAHDVTVTGSFTINQYLITYIVDGVVIKTEYVNYATAITLPSVPEREGYSFAWNEYPETMPAKDLTITGQYTINKYKLSYTVDGEEYKSYETEYGATITPENTPTKEGYTFSGWSDMPVTMPAHDVTVSGTFTVNKYKLTYIMDNKVYKEMMCEYGATVTPEPQPEGVYDTFEWIGQPETMPAHDVVVYAMYTSGITDYLIDAQQNVRIYAPNGKKLNKLQKGLNIVMVQDGTIRKIVIK